MIGYYDNFEDLIRGLPSIKTDKSHTVNCRRYPYEHTKVMLPTIKRVIFNPPATIVYWADDSDKTVVKSQGEDYDYEKGLAMAISKKAYGNSGNYYEVFKNNIFEVEEEGSIEAVVNFLHRLSDVMESKKDVDKKEREAINLLTDLGYGITIPEVRGSVAPCSCAHRAPIIRAGADGWYYLCESCWSASSPATTRDGALDNWNSMMLDSYL